MDSQANHASERRRLGGAYNTIRHPIRSTILGAIAAALVTIALVLVTNGNSALAASSLVNGNFETGNLTGWSVDSTYGGGARAVTSYDYYYQVDCIGGEGSPCFDAATIPPKEGSYFTLLGTSYDEQPNDNTAISQPFEASNGDKVNGWAFFQTYNHRDSCSETEAIDDKAQVVIKSASGTTVATPFEQSNRTVPYPPVSTGGYSGWRYWEYTFKGLTGTGKFQIEARLQNGQAGGGGINHMGLDDVKTSTGDGPDTTPPKTYITSGWGSRAVSSSCYTDSTSNTFEFHSNEQGSTFKCQLSKNGTVIQTSTDCTSPKSYSNLIPGNYYRFDVQATDPAGNVEPTPVSRYWTINVDTSAPKVMSTSPANNTTGIAPTKNVSATFSEAMDAVTTDGDPRTINGTTFKLFRLNDDGTTTRVTAAISYTAAIKKAILNPESNLTSGGTYKATVTTGAQDLAGNALDQDQTPSNGNQSKNWTFTVQ